MRAFLSVLWMFHEVHILLILNSLPLLRSYLVVLPMKCTYSCSNIYLNNALFLIFSFVVYLTMLSVTQTVRRKVIGWLIHFGGRGYGRNKLLWPIFNVLFRNLRGKPRETVGQIVVSPRISNWAPPECKSKALPLEPSCPVLNIS
jgi:hypothetical protein